MPDAPTAAPAPSAAPRPGGGEDVAHLICGICFPIGTSPVTGACGEEAFGQLAGEDHPRCAACRWLDTLPVLPCGH